MGRAELSTTFLQSVFGVRSSTKMCISTTTGARGKLVRALPSISGSITPSALTRRWPTDAQYSSIEAERIQRAVIFGAREPQCQGFQQGGGGTHTENWSKNCA